MSKLRDRKPAEGEVTKYTKKTDWEIAQLIAQRNGLDADRHPRRHGPRRGRPEEPGRRDVPDGARQAHRLRLLRRRPIRRRGKSTLHFTKPTDGRDSRPDARLQIRVGREPHQLQSHHQPVAPGEQGHRARLGRSQEAGDRRDCRARRPAQARARTRRGRAGPKPSRRPQARASRTSWSTRRSQRAGSTRRSPSALLRERAYEFITGTGQAIGLPDLRPGDNVEIEGLGERFSGHVLRETCRTRDQRLGLPHAVRRAARLRRDPATAFE